MRFSHQQRAEAVTSEHLLWGVLDVEGTAGQVLRGLGVDGDRLRTALERGADPDRTRAAEPGSRTGRSLRCASCGADLEGNLEYRTIDASGQQGPKPAVIYGCAACGHVLGVSSLTSPFDVPIDPKGP